MEELSPVAYAEVYELLNTFAFVYERIPRKIIRYIKRHASKKYVISYPRGESIFNYVSKEALELYTALYLEYAANDMQKAELKEMMVKNEMKLKAQLA